MSPGIKVLVCGSPSIIDYSVTYECIKLTGLKVRQIITGGAPLGIDELARQYAHEYHASVKQFKVYHDLQGNPDYAARDRRMCDYCDHAIILWDTRPDQILDGVQAQLKAYQKPVTLYRLPPLHI